MSVDNEQETDVTKVAVPKKGNLRSRLRTGLLAGGLLLPVALLVVSTQTRVPSAAVQIDLRSRAVAFTISSDQEILYSPLDLSTLGASGLTGFRVPQFEGPETSESDRIRLRTSPDPTPAGTIALDTGLLKAGTRVQLEKLDRTLPGEFRLSIKGENYDGLSLTLDGPVRVTVPPKIVNAERVYDGSPARLFGGGDVVNMDLGFPAGAHGTFSRSIEIRDVTLYRVDRADPAQESSVLAASVYFTEVGVTGPSIEADELLKFEGSVGILRGLAVRSDSILFKFDGTVKGMHVDVGGSIRSLMPTRFEALWQQYQLFVTLVGLMSAVYIGLVGAMLRKGFGL